MKFKTYGDCYMSLQKNEQQNRNYHQYIEQTNMTKDNISKISCFSILYYVTQIFFVCTHFTRLLLHVYKDKNYMISLFIFY
jgi:hypothetical protein